jgi:hypothetical protein
MSMSFQVDALTLKSEELAHTERFHQVRVFRVPTSAGTLLEQVDAFARAVRRQIETAEYDFVHLRSIWGMGPIYKRKQRVRARAAQAHK